MFYLPIYVQARYVRRGVSNKRPQGGLPRYGIQSNRHGASRCRPRQRPQQQGQDDAPINPRANAVRPRWRYTSFKWIVRRDALFYRPECCLVADIHSIMHRCSLVPQHQRDSSWRRKDETWGPIRKLEITCALKDTWLPKPSATFLIRGDTNDRELTSPFLLPGRSSEGIACACLSVVATSRFLVRYWTAR